MRNIGKLEGQCLSEKLLLNGRVADLAVDRKNTLAKEETRLKAPTNIVIGAEHKNSRMTNTCM